MDWVRRRAGDAGAGSLLVLRSDWFSRIVRDRIAFEAGRATGGASRSDRFFDWRTLRVELGELVIHGSEPSSGLPAARGICVLYRETRAAAQGSRGSG
jgi:hypothetical protein